MPYDNQKLPLVSLFNMSLKKVMSFDEKIVTEKKSYLNVDSVDHNIMPTLTLQKEFYIIIEESIVPECGQINI